MTHKLTNWFFIKWPEWITNFGSIETLIGTIITFFVFYQTSKLSIKYNKKIGSDLIANDVNKVYEKFTGKLKKLKKEIFEIDDHTIKNEFFILVNECNSTVYAYKEKDTDKETNAFIDEFKKQTENLKDDKSLAKNLRYEETWSYYRNLSSLNENLKKMQSINARRV